MTEEPASVAGPHGLADAAVDPTDARNAKSRIAYGASVLRVIRVAASRDAIRRKIAGAI